MAAGSFNIPSTHVVPSQDPWVRPRDWPDISGPKKDEIYFLMSDAGSPPAFNMTLEGTYTIDWGDGTIREGCASGISYSHAYKIGLGTPCSLGYTTFVCKIYNVGDRMLSFTVVPNERTRQSNQYSPILDVEIGELSLEDFTDMFQASQVIFSQLQHVGITSFRNTRYTNYMFDTCLELRVVDLPSDWGGVQSANGMFYNCGALQTIELPSVWSNAMTSVESMFQNCTSLQTVILPSDWLNIQLVDSMFQGCLSLYTINLPKIWGAIYNLSYMFQACMSLTDITIHEWPKVENVDCTAMFDSCVSLYKINLPTDWRGVITTPTMFNGCQSLPNITLPESWENITDVSYMFSMCTSLQTIKMPSDFRGITAVNNMFQGCSSLREAPKFESWGSVFSASTMFDSCYNLQFVSLPTNWGSIADASYMFSNCRSLLNVNLPADWGSIFDASYMFSGCYSLGTITLPINRGDVIIMCDGMFVSCYNLQKVVNFEFLGSRNQPVSMYSIFTNCEEIQDITISARMASFGCYGNVSAPNKIQSIIYVRTDSNWSGMSSPQINISYCSLDEKALENLFDSLEAVDPHRYISITGNPGSARCDTSIATVKGWVVIN